MRIEVPQARARGIFSRLFKAGLRAVDPYGAMLRSISIENGTLVAGPYRYPLSRYRRIVAIGAGKASARMAQALEHVLGTSLENGLVVVKYGHGATTKTIQILEAGHPVPDQQGLTAARRLLDVAKALTEKDLLIVLLSGGASSLLPAPVNGLTLQDKQHTTQLLLRSGATIQEMNTVRKHLSSLKGGQLAAATGAGFCRVDSMRFFLLRFNASGRRASNRGPQYRTAWRTPRSIAASRRSSWPRRRRSVQSAHPRGAAQGRRSRCASPRRPTR